MEDIRKGAFSPAIYYKKAGGSQVPADFSAVPMTMYGDMERRDYPSISSLLEAFYDQKNEVTRIRQKSADLRHIVQTILERDIHKYDLQLRQIRDTEKKDKYRVYGELLNAYGYGVPEGAKSCLLDNYYTGEKLTVPLDPRLTPQQNAKKYFDRYTKLKRTYEALSRLTVEVKAEIDHLESIRTSLDLSTGEGDLAMIRKEMEDAGFIRRHADSKKGRSRTPQSRPLHYISSDGFDLYVGKNNLQNDELTFKMAAPSDIWFHANDMPGSHVILKARGLAMNDIPDRVFEEAASLAAWYSSGRAQGKVEIDYLERRDVKKPGGARPGFVVYYTNYSILANPDISMLRQAD
jgi:predicted ribosome quality control (RQC) complex YloA/Tae2 family protein